jgi:subtilase family serine protease
LFGAALPATAATPDWVSTLSQALQPANALLLGSAPSTAPVHLTIGLALPDRAGLNSLLQAQQTPGNPEYHHYLTPSEFTSRFAPSESTAAKVTQYLRNAGFSTVSVASNRLQITATGTVAQAEQAFNTHINQYRQSGQDVLVNSSPAQIPSTLSGTVTGVLGLSTLGSDATPTEATPSVTGHYPKQFQTAYDATGTPTGSGTSIAIVAEGNLTPTINDLRTAETKQGLPKVPVRVVPIGPPSPDTSGATEWNLDTQSSTGIAQDVRNLTLYDATSLSDSDLSRAFNTFASQDTAQAGSASLGECELLAYEDGSQVIDDAAFAEAAAQGQTFFASSGDTGASCAVVDTNGIPDSGPISVNYPASSTYVVGVGGTTLSTDNTGHYAGETAWDAGGGGLSLFDAPGAWQANAAPISLPSGSTALNAGRPVPDIAFDGDSNTGALIYQGNNASQIGGTSLSSPLALGAWARLESAHGNSLGFAPEALYGLYNKVNPSTSSHKATPGFHDITTGSNGLYAAAPGYDLTTGLGSFDIAQLDQQLK